MRAQLARTPHSGTFLGSLVLRTHVSEAGVGRPAGLAPASPLEGSSRLENRPMGRYTGPKVKKSKRVRAPISDTAKHHKADLDRGPGVHGFSRRRKLTIYGERLREKQEEKRALRRGTRDPAAGGDW